MSLDYLVARLDLPAPDFVRVGDALVHGLQHRRRHRLFNLFHGHAGTATDNGADRLNDSSFCSFGHFNHLKPRLSSPRAGERRLGGSVRATSKPPKSARLLATGRSQGRAQAALSDPPLRLATKLSI